MNRLLKVLLLAASLGIFSTGALAAKDDSKPAGTDKAAASAATGNKASAKSDTAADSKSKAGAPIDLNSASADELKALPQIGEARAKAIIDHRPYARKDELVSKKVLTQKQYDGIKDKVIAKQGASDKAASSGASASGSDKASASGATGGKASSKSDSAATDKKK